MSVARLGVLLVVAALLTPACRPPGDDSGSRSEADSLAGGREGAGVPGSIPSADVPVCLEGGPFVADGRLEVGGSAPAGTGGGTDARVDAPPADADRISALRWERHDGCERLVLDLVDAQGEPAERPGRVGVEALRNLGVVRVTMEDVEWVAPEAADATFEGPLTGAAFAVFAPEGRWVYVDVHLREAAEVSALTLQDPARVVVDLRPGGGPVPEPASRGQGVVVLEPRPGEAAYPLTVTGYARTFEANVVVRLEREGADVHQDFTTATAWADAWGHYTFSIEDGPVGSVVLHVGEHSARDGTWQGVAVPLEMR